MMASPPRHYFNMPATSSKWPVWGIDFCGNLSFSMTLNTGNPRRPLGFPSVQTAPIWCSCTWGRMCLQVNNPRARGTRHPSQAITRRPGSIRPVANPFVGDLTPQLDACWPHANMPTCAAAASRHTVTRHISSLPLQQPPLSQKTHKPKCQAHQNPSPTPQKLCYMGNSTSEWSRQELHFEWYPQWLFPSWHGCGHCQSAPRLGPKQPVITAPPHQALPWSQNHRGTFRGQLPALSGTAHHH